MSSFSSFFICSPRNTGSSQTGSLQTGSGKHRKYIYRKYYRIEVHRLVKCTWLTQMINYVCWLEKLLRKWNAHLWRHVTSVSFTSWPVTTSSVWRLCTPSEPMLSGVVYLVKIPLPAVWQITTCKISPTPGSLHEDCHDDDCFTCLHPSLRKSFASCWHLVMSSADALFSLSHTTASGTLRHCNCCKDPFILTLYCFHNITAS